MSRLTDADGTWLGLLYFCNFIPTLRVHADRRRGRRPGGAQAHPDRTATSSSAVTVGALGAFTLTDHIRAGDDPAVRFPHGHDVRVQRPRQPGHRRRLGRRATTCPARCSLNSTGANVSRVDRARPSAAPLLTIWNEGAAFIVYAATSVIVVFLLRRVRLRTYERETGVQGFWSWLRSGWDYAARATAGHAGAVDPRHVVVVRRRLPRRPADRRPEGVRRGRVGLHAAGAPCPASARWSARSSPSLRVNVPTLRSLGLQVAAFGCQRRRCSRPRRRGTGRWCSWSRWARSTSGR